MDICGHPSLSPASGGWRIGGSAFFHCLLLSGSQAGGSTVPRSEKKGKKKKHRTNTAFSSNSENEKRENPLGHDTGEKGQRTSTMLKQQEEENTVFERSPEGNRLFLFCSSLLAELFQGYTTS